MNMTLLVNPWERAARIVEAHAFAAGDVATVTVNGVQGADPASLQLRLFRDATMRQPVAAAGTFEPLPGRRDAFSASLPLDSSDMLDWFDDSVSESSGDDDEDVVRLLRLTPEDRAERAVRTDGWLVVADSSRVWVACRVPVILRAFPGLGRVPADSWSAVVRAAVLEASAQADWEESSEGSPAFIKNKPAPVQADWDESSSGDPAFIKNKPAIAQADWEESSSGDPAFIKNKPTIPAPVSVDATLTRQGAAADAKAVGDALRGGFTEWEFSGVPSGLSVASIEYNSSSAYWKITLSSGEYGLYNGFADGVELLTTDITGGSDGFPGGISATRRLITPTKTSQLTNDGAPNGGGTPYATTEQIPDVTGKADKAVPSAAGNLASLTAQGNLADSGEKASDFAAKADLSYALVEPGKWEYAPLVQLTSFAVTSSPEYSSGVWTVSYYSVETGNETIQVEGDADALSLDFAAFLATRPSLPGHLCDRAGNRVVVSGDTTLTLPAANPGYLRDFLVRLEISGSTVPTITFAAPTGETITYETDGDEFPVSDEAGDWLYSFTESCVAHKFAVSLKKVTTVAQGGA